MTAVAGKSLHADVQAGVVCMHDVVCDVGVFCANGPGPPSAAEGRSVPILPAPLLPLDVLTAGSLPPEPFSYCELTPVPPRAHETALAKVKTAAVTPRNREALTIDVSILPVSPRRP